MIQRLWRHLVSPSVRRSFPPATLQAITEAIASGEQRHGGQVMFAVEADLPLHALWRGVTARQAAEQAFAQLRTWDTHHNNGVLIYLLLADHAIEIVADRGLHGRVSPAQWQRVCTHLREGLRGADPVEALRDAIDEVSGLVEGHFPASTRSDDDGLPNTPQILG
ncbi:TPA: TPM domain-containing protein [Stenotrophomonas maltophilia]|uniref:TPM domain-containing protein n=1 Tax=Stenotrophomonas TaxID=40323 RepID=UPI0028AA5A19|nr:TPM domain-containing protein [Stenotrophomonas sp.]HDS0950843.1 TPM domain-containing protein [Stenotrophomonas maltophilia]HDS1027080.1 TPM domain-containing protein [Stenotrophomonas maltophilia]HDS1032301.1 TPM domain-containing protein [Stenotrophomonas maltophilia]HDS1035919.1 TPM domain-containing protein [Stenotrophomonas maltophilia]HDS1040239.1 TPM domain-containing protein [Stenotrophomonas maltophilia]